MNSNTLSGLFLILCLVQICLCGVITTPPPLADETKEDFEREIRIETEEFLNNIFQNQINFYNKFKTSLNPETQRFKDIEIFVGKLDEAKQEKDLTKKDEIYWDSLKKFDKSPLLLNEETETGLNDDDYQQILEDNGIKELMKNFLADVAIYFWKMAKHSGKVLVTKVNKLIDNMQKDKTVL